MIKYFIFSVLFVYFIQRIRPVKGLKKIIASSFSYLIKDKPAHLKLLDVRDQFDFYAGHIEGALNISLGRLPYVKKSEIHVDDEIIIIADSNNHCKRAARALKKSGYHHLTYLEDGMSAYQRFQENHQNYSKLQTCV
ncbi:rhodanese-like domain-containing protein [Paenibacillus chondroitinus]|uniref:Rhodanese-like domain-containing protein n=1 Tax=Paenibacillus chondroitinus TaxID=59842 RepID=A0ABU6DJ66_9BACL|nr:MULTISPECIES: rhodanese-like domain-containing protein [Paenibacillus]MCY9659632.1 rhodanese-like domain-containing protein [Paenibacillus anseongense]MEB4797028.1 rhodanese-like domain-containing protein [Paenibacillus chondroitinus]